MKLSEYLNQNGMTAKEYFEMRKRKEEGKTSLSDYQRKLYQEIKSTDLSDIVNDLSSNKFLDQETLTYYNDRVSQVADKVSRFKMGDEESNKSFLDNLKTLQSGISKASEYYSTFKDENDYKAQLKSIEQNKEWASADTKTLKTEIDDLESNYNSYIGLKTKRDDLYSTIVSGYMRAGYGREKAEKVAASDGRIAKYDKELSQYGDMSNSAKTLSDKKQYYNNAKRIQDGIALRDNAKNAEDFEKYSQMGADIDNPTYDEVTGHLIMPLGVKKIKNKVTYSRDNYEEYEDTTNSKRMYIQNENGSKVINGINEIYTQMTDEEVAIYNYYLSKEGEEKADQFLDSITESLNYRQAEKTFEDIYRNNALLEGIFGFSAGVDQWVTGVKSLFNADGEYVPSSVTQIMSGMAREDVGDDYGIVGQGGYDLLNTTGNMLPSILISTMAGNFAGAAGAGVKAAQTIGKIAGAATLGASAAGNGYQEMLNLGYDKNQAQAYGTLVGISEAGLEYALGGISSLGGKFSGGITDKVVTKLISNFDNAIAKVAIGAGGKLVGSMVSEFGEEYLQEVLDPVFKNITLHTDEDIKLFSTEALYSGILGALSAGLLEGGSAISGEVATYKAGKDVKNSGQLSNLKKFGTSFSADTVAYKIASQVNENTDAYTIGQLLHEVGADSLSEANIAEITKSLERKGIAPENAQTIAKWLNKAVEGGNFTKAQIKALENPDISQTFKDVIINQNSTVNQRMQGYTDILQNIVNEKETQKANKTKAKAETKGNKTKTTEETTTTPFAPLSNEAITSSKIEALAKELENSGISPELAQIMAQKKISEPTEGISTSDTKNAVESKFETNLDGKTVNIKSGEEVKISEIASIDNGKMTLKLDNGETVDAEDISFGTEEENLIYSTVLDMGVNAAVANSLVKNYNPSEKLSAKQYVLGIKEAYKYGTYSIPMSEMSKKGFAADLSEAQRTHAYNLGKADAKSNVEKAQKEVEKVVSDKSGIEGKVYFKGDELALKEVQRESLKRMGVLSDVLGVQFHVFESYVVNGKRVYKDTDGKVKKAPNGYYKDGKIYIDLNAGRNGQGVMIYTVAHELGHFIKDWSPAKFKILADFLMEQYGKKGHNVNDLVQAQIEKAKRNGRTIDYDTAYEEMVCDSLELMLRDDAVYEKILELKSKDASIVKKIGEFFAKIVDSFKKLMQQYPPETPEGKLVSQMNDSFTKIQELFAEALVDASNNYQANKGQKTTTSEGDVKYEIRYPQFESSDFEQNIVMLSQMQIVKKLSGNEFAKSEKPLSERVMDYFNSLNNNVYSDLFGDVALTASSMRDDIYGHGRTSQKITAFAAIPEVIQEGVVIDSQKRGNGNYDRIIVAAPISIGKDKYFMGVMLQRDHQSQRLYLHDVVAVNEKETMQSPSTTPFTSEVEGNNDSLYMTSILKKALNVKEISKKSQEKLSGRDNDIDIDTQINQSMTMDEAKQMVQRAFVLGEIQEWYDNEYKNGDEWLKAQGADEVAMYIENEYTLQEKYINKIQGIIDDEFYVADVLEAYLKGTLTGKEKPKAKRLDVSVNHRINDARFYSPQRIENVKQLFDVASQKLTSKNRAEVSSARAKILLFAHNSGASELLGLSQAELNKKLRSWSGYTAGAREISEKLNKGVADSNKWTGIENCSWLYKSQVTTEELESLVKSVEGAASDYEKLYIARTMLALDTHIDWSWLSIEFDTKDGVNKKYNGSGRCNGFYNNDGRKIVSSHNSPDTIAHEMGHALDYQWGRDLGFSRSALTDVYRNTKQITDADTKQFFDNFKIFLDSLTDNGDIRSEYTQDPKEVFARFIARFIQWVDNTGTGHQNYNYEYSAYKDNFTASHYIEFVKLLQEKAMLDSKKVAEGDDVKFSDRDSEGNELSKEQIDFFANSKVRDSEGNLLVCYHGTDAKFTVFDKSKINSSNGAFYGKGFYFSNSKSAANQYGNNVYEYYLNITNPLYLDDENWVYDLGIEKKKESLKVIDAKLEETRKGFYTVHYKDSSSPNTWKSLDRITKPQIDEYGVYGFVERRINPKPSILPRDVKDIAYLAQEKGYDGIIGNGTNITDFGTVEYVVFDENQIKSTSNINPTSNPDIRYSDRDPDAAKNIEKINKQLAKENVKLIEDVKNLKELVKLQGKETHGKMLKKSTVELVAKRLMAYSNAKGNVSELVSHLTDVYNYIIQGEDVSWESIQEKSQAAVDWLMQNEYHKPVRDEYANDILKHLRTMRVSLDEVQKKEAAYYFGSFNDFRKKNMGRIIITNEGIPLDSAWQELSELYPSHFDINVNSSDQPIMLMSIIDGLQNSYAEDEYHYYSNEMVVRDLMTKVYEGYWDVSSLHTVADAKQKEINLLKAKHKESMEELKKTHAENDAKLRQEHKDRISELRTQYREREETKLKKVAEYYQKSRKEAVDRVKENREKREAITKLQRLVLDTAKWVSYPAKDAIKCPDIIRVPYAEFLSSIDLSSKRLLNGGEPTQNDLRVSSAMDSLAKAIEKKLGTQSPDTETETVLDTGYLDLPVHFVENLKELAENLKKRMVTDGHIVNSMTSEEVKELTKFIRTLNHSIKDMSTLYSNMRFARVEQLGNDTMLFLKDLGKAKQTNSIKDFVTWDNALPYYTFKRFGVGGESVFEELMDAQDKLAYLADEIFKFKEKTWNDKEASEWSKDTHTIELPSGRKLTLTSADAMSIYCLSRREQGRQHLLGGGVRVLGIEKNGKKANDSRSLLNQQDILAIASSLTERQRKVAETIQQYMSTTCAEWGNEISMKRFLTKEFTEKFYFPIESNDENLDTKDPKAQQSDLYRLLNISATKPLTKGANNEVIIRNVFDVFTGHSTDMARLNAYGMALLDYMKWINYREKTVNDDGQISVSGVRKSMTEAYGDEAKKYVIGLIKDINGRATDGGDHPFLMKMTRMAKTAMVGANLRVSLLQFTAYPRAAMVLSNKSLALGLTKIPQIEKAKKYCGIALWKSFGFYDTNISRSIEDQLKGTTNVRQKLIELSLKGAEWGDAITWGCLWNACEYEVAKTKQYKVGSEEFNQAVGKKLREVVYATQVVDSTLTRSQMMRNKSGLTQSASAFMSEPTLSANILMDAGFQFKLEKRRTGSNKLAWQKVGKYIGKAVAVYSIGQIIAALAEALADAYRDDDDEEYLAKFRAAFTENAISDLNPFNKIPLLADVSDLILSWFGIGFSSSNSLYLQAVSEASNAFDTWSKVINGEDGKTVYAGIFSTTKLLSYITGVSASGLMREVVTLWNNTAGAADPYLKIRTYESSATDKGIAEYKFDKGDTTSVKTTVSKMIEDKVKSGKTEKEAKSAVRSSFTSTYKSEYLAAVKAKDYDEMNRIRKFLYATGLYGTLTELDETLKKWRTDE